MTWRQNLVDISHEIWYLAEVTTVMVLYLEMMSFASSLQRLLCEVEHPEGRLLLKMDVLMISHENFQ